MLSQLCPNLETLHLRSDHITFAFFHSLIDLAVDPPRHDESTTSIDSDAPLPPTSPSSLSDIDVDLASPLQILLIQYRLPTGDATVHSPPSLVSLLTQSSQAIKGNLHGSYLAPRRRMIPFVGCCLEIEAKGLA